ncbi:hypothetical protein BZL30_0089 [Mycobacterium kansasii]|uniref:Uncharacterized protein n=1 Tax=Mycobacterium kansasii TaxID=1768 RepID=A0A1V3XSB4_MYCKA|nr:hypothetical protein BZL30_0089 [Mycobacterium kansasii]
MNHALITGVSDALAPHGPTPGWTRAAKVLRRAQGPSVMSPSERANFPHPSTSAR